MYMKSATRLFTLFQPEHYELSLTIERTERTFEGTVTIKGELTHDADELRLHAKDLQVKSALIDGKEASVSYEPNDELSLSLAGLTMGAHIITLTYSGKITNNMNGIYPCYFEVDGEKQELIATQFESHYARQAFPCIDEPEAKATFDVTLTTENNITVLGNMPIKSQREENGRLVTTFDTTPRMSSYLVAWVAGDLQKKTATTKGGIEVAVWSTKAHDPSNLDFALDIATRTIDFFDEYFGVPYPLPKADHVALPDFSSGAMENWGLITYREIALLADPKTTTLSAKHYVATVVAHELSHQWFGNLVTMKWWNDLWLNESFANMMEYVAVDALEPSWDVWLDQATTEVVSALRRDSLDGVQSIQIDVHHPDEISTIFDPSIVYAKGGRLLRMLQAYIGDDAMRTGLKHYFTQHQYMNTQADDLWASLSKASGKDISSFMHAWMTQPGFPIVTASQNGDTITLSQQQFFIGAHEEKNRTWPIPLHGVNQHIPESLQGKDLTFSYASEEVFRINNGGTAHFITQYEQPLLGNIIQNLASLSAVDKLNFLHEQLLICKAGRQSFASIIPLLQFFKDETNESVWSIVSLAINELKRFVEPDSEAEQKLRSLVGELVSRQYERLGWDELQAEDENDTKLRSNIIGLALFAELPDAVSEAERRFADVAPASLDPELRVAIMAHAVRTKNPATTVDMLLDEYPKTTNSELRDDIAAALTSTKDTFDVQRLISLLKNTEFIRMQDFTHWFVWLLRNRYSREEMWSWTRSEWNWIEATFKADSSYDIFPRYVAGALATRKQLDEYKEFFASYESDVTLARNISIGYTELESIVSLIETDASRVREALLDLK